MKRRYEKKTEPLAPVKVYYSRILINLLIAIGVLSFCLLLGVFGYHYIADVPWIDALHNASMILSGMGPVVQIDNFSGKVFSSAYALFSGVVFITNIGFILAPAIHRLFHKLHVDGR
ncbi:MAG: hypothetical protein K0Q79_2577 [Flavipsychrobacter sp.]|jgi:hypothetical protein|nr:hypothetical protein [Flavipsychrobacter sp.]